MATRRRTKSATDDKIQKALIAWSSFTWARDTQPTLFKVPHVLVNWLAVFALCALWWFRWSTWWMPLAIATVVGLLYTCGRAARQIPARRKSIESLYAATAKPCGHPRSTRTTPVDPASRVVVKRWKGPKRPVVGAIAYGADSPAAAPATRWTAEKAVEAILGETTVFDYDAKPGWLMYEVVAEDDVRLAQKRTRRWIESTVAQMFPARRGAGDDFSIDITWADGPEGPTDTPAQVDVGFGAYDVSARDFRDKVERGFDANVNRGPEWIYDWTTPGLLAIRGVDPTSGDAIRKRLARKITDVVIGAVNRAVGRQGAAQAQVQVTRWVPDGHPAAHTPVEVTISLGTADYSSILTQQQVENTIDQALETEWTDRVWLPDWVFGAEAALTLAAVPRGHQMALRKAEDRRLRAVVSQKFKAARGGIPVDLDVHEWISDTDETGTIIRERAARLTVKFGTVDVTKAEKRREFQDHFDSLTDANDWRYEWQAHSGIVDITAVTPLPRYIPFPAEGTPECEEWHERFRNGEIFIGPAKGGYEAVIKLNSSPHMLVGGSTGAGKSVLLSLIIYGALMNPSHVEIIVIDPKVTDFTWAGTGWPNVLAYAPEDARTSNEAINQAVTFAAEEMMRRQNLLRRFGVEKLSELRRTVASGQVTGIEPEDIPKRLIVFFDEGGSAFTPSKDPDIKALQDDSRTKMEQIGMLGRAMEVNIVMAAQKPSNENIGTAMRSQVQVNAVGIGKLDTQTSIQVMGNTLCAELDEGAPKGRGWYVNDAGQELLVQTFYLPKRNEPDPFDPSVELQGIQERAADLLTGLGWQEIKVPKQFTAPKEDGSMETYTVMTTEWVDSTRVDA